MAIAEACDAANVATPNDLPSAVQRALKVDALHAVGSLRRSPYSGGITIYPAVRAEFVDNAPADFADVIDAWLDLDHVWRHVAKTERAAVGGEKHLFIVATDDTLPSRYFTDDFTEPTRLPDGFRRLDGLWILSNFWHRFLGWQHDEWRWFPFPDSSTAID